MVRERLRRRLNSSRDASVAYRCATAACVLVSVTAAVRQQAVGGGTGVAAIALVPVGFVFSYMRRGQRNVVLKILLTAALLLVFAAFISSVRGATSVDDTRAPLVGLFLWVQVLHSFDVPRPRDLAFSVAASVVLIALAGSLAFSSSFIMYVAAFAVIFATALALGHLDDLSSQETEPAIEIIGPATKHAVGVLRRGAALATVVTVATSVVFVFLPRLGVTQIATLPFSVGRGSPIPGFNGGVTLPSLAGQRNTNGSSRAFDPNSYFGFGSGLDLHARGKLSNELVLRVRTPKPSLYRAQVFDTYGGGRWTSSDSKLTDISGDGIDPIPIAPPIEERGVTATHELTQTFYVERDLPNVIFHAYRAREVYVSSTHIRTDKFSSLRLPYLLEKDSIYSVVSDAPDVSRPALLNAPSVDPGDPAFAQYRTIPVSLSGRFSELARTITSHATSEGEKAIAVQSWLHAHKRYRLDIPRDPPGRDPVDVFVFDRKDGFCEQIAATMALMLRASGVPTRVVTGFGPGERNLFTGYWEVRNSDSHAWVEVFYPDYGWIPYDPTFGVPLATASNTTFMLTPLKKLAEIFPAVVGRISKGISAALPGQLAVEVPVGLLLVLAVLVLRRRTSKVRRRLGRGASDRSVDTWLALERALAKRGLLREPQETAREFAERVAASGVDVRDLADEFGAFRYGGAVEGFEEWDGRVRELAKTVKR